MINQKYNCIYIFLIDMESNDMITLIDDMDNVNLKSDSEMLISDTR